MAASSRRVVHRQRLARQRLSSAGLRRGSDVVRLLACVQAQDAPLAAWSLAMRMQAGTTYAALLAEQAAGGWVRTHVLRPTWHLVAPEDLRWIQRATGPKVESSLAGGHRNLGLDAPTKTAALELLGEVLGGRSFLTRRELTRLFADRGLPSGGQQMGHLLLCAELRAVICSGPPRGTAHTYALVDETVPPSPNDGLDGEDARRELVRRFMSGHGPACDRDLSRWCTLTLTEVRRALADLEDELARVDVDGQTLWFDPATMARTTRAQPGYLLPTFDEVCLTYATTGFPRRDPAAPRQRLLSEAGGGIVVVDGEDLGTWKRTASRTVVTVTVVPDVPLGREDVEAVADAARSLAAFLERPLDLVVP